MAATGPVVGQSKQISQLPAAKLPLTGDELVMVVQNATPRQATVNDVVNEATASAQAAADAAAASQTAAAGSANDALISKQDAANSAAQAVAVGDGAVVAADSAAVSAAEAQAFASLGGIPWAFDATTAMADPGTGAFRLNNATVASVTAIAVSALSGDTGNPDVSAYVANWADSTSVYKGTLTLRKKTAPATFAIFYVTNVVDNGTWLELTTVHSSSNGTLTAADIAYIGFAASGDQGSDKGIPWTFDVSTSMADPGAGGIRFNNAAVASVTEIAVSSQSADAGNPDISDFVATWDDSNATNKGTLSFRKDGSNSDFAIFTVTALVDNGSWLQLTVAHASSNGTWSAADVPLATFARTGDNGLDGSAANITFDQFTGDGIDTTFTLTATPASNQSCFTYIDGVRQAPGTDFSVSGTTLTFVTAPANLSKVYAFTISSSPIGTPADGSVSTAKIIDAAVTTGKIAANAVDATKLFRGTTAGQILTSNGAGADPSYQDAPSGAPAFLLLDAGVI